jgi:quinol monooxygenase YgiN
MTISVVVTFQVDPRSHDAFEALVARVRPVMMGDPGCLRYDLQRAGKDSSSYVLLETYRDRESLKRHSESEAFRALEGELKGLLTAAAEMKVLRGVGEQVRS